MGPDPSSLQQEHLLVMTLKPIQRGNVKKRMKGYTVTLFFNQFMHFIFYLFSEGILFLLFLPVKLFFLLCYIKYLMVYKAFVFINFSCIIYTILI